ncbi:translation initiation factor [Hydrogenimonas sp.]|uniref:translation initiation factor n=1 Tax=Hydrogenimonas sp. TaxID=2231112 RepID=UPI002637EBC8|nr:translation initiation factor [Hydrogenimonas sp.]
MAKGVKLDIEFGSLGEGWEADNKAVPADLPKETLPPEKHRLVFRREKRKGKPVTLVGEFFLDRVDEKSLLKGVRKSLGSGGTFKKGWMELQGDRAEQLRVLLEKEGYRFKT